MIEWTHDKLLDDLRLAKETIYVNVPLGSVWNGIYRKAYGVGVDGLPKFSDMASMNIDERKEAIRKRNEILAEQSGTPLADVLVVRPSYSQFCISIFEVKVSRADFQSDIRTNKWLKYLPHCHRFYFATADGICDKSEIPDPAGLIVRKAKTWWTAKQPIENSDIAISGETMMSLVFYRNKIHHTRKLEQPFYSNYANEYDVDAFCKDRFRRKLSKKIGKNLGRVLSLTSEYASALHYLKYLQNKLSSQIKDENENIFV